MSIYSQEEVEERFRRLPEPLKEQMMSAENSERMFEVGKKFELTVEQIGFLAEESGYVVLGLTHPNDFVPRVKDHLRVDEQKAKLIAQEINHQIFFPLREMLKNTHQFELTQDKIQQSPSPTPSMPHLQPPPPHFPPASDIPAPSSTMSSVSHIASIPPPPPPPVVPPSSSKNLSIPEKSLPATPGSPTTPQTPLDSSTFSGVSSRGGAPMSILPSPSPILPVPPLPLNPITPSTIQEKKPNTAIPPTTPAPLKSIEDIKPKSTDITPLLPSQKLAEQSGGQSISASQTPVAPSQMMQKKFLEETKKVKPPIQSAVERIKESLFAPASAPAQLKSPTVPPAPPPQNPSPSPDVPLKPIPPSYSSGSDPYREPLE